MADFDPRQLDQLEDALDSLEEIDDLESLELSPALRERLAEYQDVLALCREAFPVEEPRAELLADVLAEAHAVSRRPQPRDAEGNRWRQFWARWRGVLVPGVALAGTAAAVLLLLDPQNQELSRRAELSDKPERVEEIDTTPSEPANMARSEEEQDLDEPKSNGDDANAPSVIPDEPVDLIGLSGAPAELSASASKKSKPRPSKDIAAATKPEPAPASPPSSPSLNKDDTWTALERANGERRKGDCDRARSRYDQIIAASTDTLAVARAKAGIGLCLEQDRRTTEADQWFEQARSDSAGIDAWIEKQRDEQPLPGEIKKSKSQPLPANADAL